MNLKKNPVSHTDLRLDKLSAALEQGLDFSWVDVYDFVNPFGDRRGGAFSSVWRFDLDKDLIFLSKENQLYSASLELARERLLTLDDFEELSSPEQTLSEEQILAGPYWEPELDVSPRVNAYIGRILRDFAFTWRHVLRRQMQPTTFKKLAYATIWILRMDFTIIERMGFEHISIGGPYVQLIDLPSWDSPEATLVQVGSSWFALARDAREGLEIVRRHMNSSLSLGDSVTNVVTYTILTLRQVILCKVDENGLVWTRPETLFGDSPASDTAINMLLWAIHTSNTEKEPSLISRLPLEIQDRILHYARPSFVASAKLGCELGLGSPFFWDENGARIMVEHFKRHRFESSPVESHIAFNGLMSGLSYKRERGY
jgi:hypothetical protein